MIAKCAFACVALSISVLLVCPRLQWSINPISCGSKMKRMKIVWIVHALCVIHSVCARANEKENKICPTEFNYILVDWIYSLHTVKCYTSFMSVVWKISYLLICFFFVLWFDFSPFWLPPKFGAAESKIRLSHFWKTTIRTQFIWFGCCCCIRFHLGICMWCRIFHFFRMLFLK